MEKPISHRTMSSRNSPTWNEAYPRVLNRFLKSLDAVVDPDRVSVSGGDLGEHDHDQSSNAPRELAMEMNTRLVKEALALGGTSTGEHGVRLGKQKHMLRKHGEATLNLMRQLKTLLDPNNILNPGKILPRQTRSIER